MRRLIFTQLACLAIVAGISASAIAQNQEEKKMETFFDLKKMTVGYSIGVGFESSEFNGNSIITGCLSGGAVFNHQLLVGIGLKGILNMPFYEDIARVDGEEGDEMVNGVLQGGYGGLLLEPILMSTKKLHVSFPLIVGMGGLFYMTDRRYTHISNSGETVMRRRTIDNDFMFVVEPGVDLEANIFSFMKVAVGVRYRFAPNLNLGLSPEDAFNGFSTGLTFKFGRF
jgi:hypothetical protein